MNSFARDFPIVCVGGSAGGSAAYVELLRHLPPGTGAAIVVVNHIREASADAPQHPSSLHKTAGGADHGRLAHSAQSCLHRPGELRPIPCGWNVPSDANVKTQGMARRDYDLPAFSGAKLGWKTSRCDCLRPGFGWGKSAKGNQGSRRHYYSTGARHSRVVGYARERHKNRVYRSYSPNRGYRSEDCADCARVPGEDKVSVRFGL